MKKVLSVILSTVMLFSMGITSFAAEKGYIQVTGTNMYYDSLTTAQEVKDVTAYWNLIPTSIINIMNQYGIKIYLIGDKPDDSKTVDNNTSVEIDFSVEDSLIPYNNPNDPSGPLYIEKDPYDVSNMKLIQNNGKEYILMHGYLINSYGIKPGSEKWRMLEQLYLESAPIYGENYVAAINEDNGENYDSTICATSWGPNVEYDADNGYKFVRIVKSGYTDYYSNSTTYLPETVLHEAGHHLDWMSVPLSGSYKNTLFGISDSAEWKALYQNNLTKLSSIDAISTSNVSLSLSEGFADAFRLTYQRPDTLKNVCPDVYNYVIAQVNKYGVNNGSLDTFDFEDYATRYPDVVASYGNDKEKLYKHYIEFGKAEGRTAKFI